MMEGTLVKNRIEYFDFCKGFLIFCVVWGHLCAYTIDNSQYMGRVLTCYITLFQMPLFMFVSGFFQKGTSNINEFWSRTKKSIRRMGLPLLTYVSISAVLLIVQRIIVKSHNVFIPGDIRGVVSVYWFLPCLLFCVMSHNILSMLAKKLGGAYIYILFGLMLMLIPSHFYYIPFLWPFYMFGVLYHKYQKKIDEFIGTVYGKITLIIFGVVFWVGGWLFPRVWTFYEMQNTVWENQFILILRFVLYFVSTMFVFFALRIIYSVLKDGFIGHWFVGNGKTTLTIFAAHLMLIYYVYKPFGVFIMQGSLLAYYVVVPIITIIIITVLSKTEILLSNNNLTKRLFLGM